MLYFQLIIKIQWKSLTQEERAPYDELARVDKDRYRAECAKRDEDVLRAQEERRKKNEVGDVLETSKRNSTQAASDAITSRSDVPRKQRFVSEEEREKKEERRQEKKQEEQGMKAQHDELKAARAAQAEARLKYLLSQSDIFSHFGVGKAPGTANAPRPSSSSTDAASPVGKRNRESKQNLEEMDDDERALMAEEADEGPSAHRSLIVKQPSIITGGQLRQYQIEGLEWMIRLADNGINGILADEMGTAV